MTFLELQNAIQQTRKSRRGVSNRRDYFENDEAETERVYNQLYQKALRIANQVINHYVDLGYFDQSEKISVNFGTTGTADEHRENQRLREQVEKLSAEIAKLRSKFTHGGRKGYDETMAQAVRLARDNGESWRSLANRLNISTATAQKLYKISFSLY